VSDREASINGGRCCENGFFGQTHDCRKGKPDDQRQEKPEEVGVIKPIDRFKQPRQWTAVISKTRQDGTIPDHPVQYEQNVEHIKVIELSAYVAKCERLTAAKQEIEELKRSKKEALELADRGVTDIKNELEKERARVARLLNLLKQYKQLHGSPGYLQAVEEALQQDGGENAF